MKRPFISLDHIGTFALALTLAIIVWVVSVQQENPLESRTLERVPVTLQNMPDDVVLAPGSTTSFTTNVRMRARRSVWDSFTSSDVEATVDLASATVGREEWPIKVDFNVPDIELVRADPDALVLRLEPKITKDVPVQLDIPDTPPLGYINSRAIMTPTVVSVTGPQSLVDTIDHAQVSAQLRNAREDVHITDGITLRTADGSVVNNVEATPGNVVITIPIAQQQGFVDKSVRVRWGGNPAANYRITGVSADPAIVTLIGDPDTLASLPPYVETTPIDIEGATQNIEERLAVELPESVALLGEQAVNIRIGIEPIEGSITLSLKPVVQGLRPDLEVESISPETLDIILVGPLARLQTLTEANIRAIVELSNLNAGVHELSPLLVLPEGITAQAILPDLVQVTIARRATTPTPR